MKENPTMRMQNFTQILEPNIVGYTTTLADGLTVEFFRCYNTVWAVHTITAEGERRAIEPGTYFANAYKIARKAVRTHKLTSV